jgi:hypothetical protein
MNTTNIFVELVVVGFHTLIWMGLIVLALVGHQNLDVEKLLTVNLAIAHPGNGLHLGNFD